MTDHQNLLDLVQKGLNGGENVDEVTERLKNLAQILGQELDDQTALELAQQLVPADDPPPPPAAPPPPPAAPPPPPAHAASLRPPSGRPAGPPHALRTRPCGL